ncbi:MAG: hypothetical protein AB1665_00970 [Candidatus Thermoplasmatota archaeon]
MAKRKGKEKDEDKAEIKFPEFDEREYLRTEVRDAKTVLLSSALGALLGVIAALTVLVHFAFGLLLALVGFALLKPIYEIMKIETEEFKVKEWLFGAGTYFFVFLAVWILLVNPPVMDLSPPVIRDVKVAPFEPGAPLMEIDWQEVNESGLAQVPSGQWIVKAVVTDNDKVDAVTLSIEGSQPSAMWYEPLLGAYVLNGTAVGLVTIAAKDRAGNSAIFRFTVNYA